MNNTDPNTEERLQKIESHLAHLEHLFDQLNQIVVEQSNTLRRMQNNQQRLASTMEQLELDRIRSTNTKPPHYSP
jgi:uncharacterized coiled-coil protein SlyX